MCLAKISIATIFDIRSTLIPKQEVELRGHNLTLTVGLRRTTVLPYIHGLMFAFLGKTPVWVQGHYHNGDQVARRPHMMCAQFVVADLRLIR